MTLCFDTRGIFYAHYVQHVFFLFLFFLLQQERKCVWKLTEEVISDKRWTERLEKM